MSMPFRRVTSHQSASAAIATPNSPTPMAIATAAPLPSLLRAIAAPVCVGELVALVALPPTLVEAALEGAVLVLLLEDD